MPTTKLIELIVLRATRQDGYTRETTSYIAL